MKDAKVRIQQELRKFGWKIYGFKEDRSDSMSDYYDPADWDGIAEKNGFILCVDINDYDVKSRSGKAITRYNRSLTMSQDDREKISKLENMTVERGATQGEEDNAKKLIENIKSKTPSNVDPYEIIGYFPTFQEHPSKNCKWHIEKDGSIYDKGTGISKYSGIPADYLFDINKCEYREGYTHWNTYSYEDRKEKEVSDDLKKLVSDFKSLLLRWERVTNGCNTMGDGTKETNDQAVEQNRPLEKVTITKTKKEIKPIEVIKDNFAIGDIISFSYHGHYWIITNIYVAPSGNNRIVYECLGSEKKGYKQVKNTKSYYQMETRLKKELEEGKIKIYELKEVETEYTEEKLIARKSTIKPTKEEKKQEDQPIQEAQETQQADPIITETPITGGDLMNQNDTKNYIETMQTKIKTDISAIELQEYYIYLRDNIEVVKIHIMDKLNNSDKHKRKRKATKEELTDSIYDKMIEALVYVVQDVFSMQIDFNNNHNVAKQNAIERIIFNATDKQITVRLEQKKQQEDSSNEYKKEIIASITSPKTLEDFDRVKRFRKTSLTQEEQSLYDALYSLDQLEQRQKELTKEINKIITATNTDYTITADKDTRDGSDLWVVSLNNRVDRDAFNSINSKMKDIKGYYSRFKSGFIFRYDPTIILTGETTTSDNSDTETDQAVTNTNANKLRQVADNMTNKIEDLRRERLTNTWKRSQQAASAEDQAESMERKQQILNNIADAIDQSELKFIGNIDSKAQIDTLEQILIRASWKYKECENIDYNTWKQTEPEKNIINYVEIPSSKIYLRQLQSIISDIKDTSGFKLISNRLQKVIDNVKITDKDKDPYVDITEYAEEFDKIYKNTDTLKGQYFESAIEERRRLERMGINSVEELRAYLREYWQYRNTELAIDPKVRNIKELERKYRMLQKEDIHFTDNKNLLNTIMDLADIDPTHKVLEPSAGIGSIADKLKEYSNNVDVCEYNHNFAELLTLKNHNVVANDFLTYNSNNKYDRIVANVPFSDEQNHIKQIYNNLKIGGKAVIITSPHYTFASDKKSQDFRNWLEQLTHEIIDVPEKSFSYTQVNCKILVLDKEEELSQIAI
jgi:protein-L-isoaspartate O-methyltransferase